MAGFQHAALVYDGPEGFAAGAVPFIREGIDAGEPMMVAVGAESITRLRDELGDGADAVHFVDMGRLGRNPGRIIPAWQDFLAERGHDRPVRGIGEPIWAGRTPDELLECQLHESLLNLAFADAEDFRLLCPYDRAALDASVVHEACCSHPAVVEDGERRPSASYRVNGELLAPFATPLAPPRGGVEALAFDADSLDELRAVVARRAEDAGLDRPRAMDLVLAVNEAAANSVRHGGGNGVLRVWREGDSLICEVRDRGLVEDPLVGRRKPSLERTGGWGVYIAHQICDLVQLRSGRQGTVVRLHMRSVL